MPHKWRGRTPTSVSNEATWDERERSKTQQRKITDLLGLEFNGPENAGLEIGGPVGRFLKTYARLNMVSSANDAL